MSGLWFLMALQLSATDLRDLRCSYVSEKFAATKSGEEKATVTWLQQWFDGRLSARHPTLNILDYNHQHFGKSKVTEADFEKCSQIYTDWAAQQIVGTPPK
jgi:hypothetical protein